MRTLSAIHDGHGHSPAIAVRSLTTTALKKEARKSQVGVHDQCIVGLGLGLGLVLGDVIRVWARTVALTAS